MSVRSVRGRLTILEAGEAPVWAAACDVPIATGRATAGLRADRTPVGQTALASGSPEGWDAFERVLAVRLDAIGDVLMTTPALRALKEARPERHLALLTSSAAAGIARLLPEVDEVVLYDPPWMKATQVRGPHSDHDIVERLRAGRYDAAAIFTVQSQSALPAALLTHLAGIPRRLAHVREKPYGLLTEWVAEPEPNVPLRHEARRQLDLVASVRLAPSEDHLSLRVPATASRRVRSSLAAAGLGRRPWVVVHPGSTAASRRYPVEGWEAVVRELVAGGWDVAWTGAPNERSFVDELAASAGGRPFAGRLDLAELSALIAAAPLLATNNSGPAHIAAAVGTPVVDVYAQTNPQHAPWRVPNRVLFADVPCRGCASSVCPAGHHRCLRDVPPDAVVAAILDLADETGAVARWAAEPPDRRPRGADTGSGRTRSTVAESA